MRGLAACTALIGLVALQSAAALPQRAFGNTGETPRAAAIRYLRPGTNFRIAGIESAGRFAVVRFSGALMEGDPAWHGDLLIERFPFGWQVVDTVEDACLRERGVTPAELAALAGRYVPARRAPKDQPCADLVDRGPIADVVAVRNAVRSLGELIPYVRVSGDYALVEWTLPGGGQAFYGRRNGRWSRLGGGGGFTNVEGVHAIGAPWHDACAIVTSTAYDSPGVRARCAGERARGSAG
jgi:hypothetical protein